MLNFQKPPENLIGESPSLLPRLEWVPSGWFPLGFPAITKERTVELAFPLWLINRLAAFPLQPSPLELQKKPILWRGWARRGRQGAEASLTSTSRSSKPSPQNWALSVGSGASSCPTPMRRGLFRRTVGSVLEERPNEVAVLEGPKTSPHINWLVWRPPKETQVACKKDTNNFLCDTERGRVCLGVPLVSRNMGYRVFDICPEHSISRETPRLKLKLPFGTLGDSCLPLNWASLFREARVQTYVALLAAYGMQTTDLQTLPSLAHITYRLGIWVRDDAFGCRKR